MPQGPFENSIPPLRELLPEVIRQLGYPGPGSVSRDVRAEIRGQIRRAVEIMEPAFFWKSTQLENWGRGIIAAKGLEIRSRMWANFLAQLQEPSVLCCFVLTLGRFLDQAIASLQTKSLFQAYLLDAAASVLAEEMADQVEQHVSQTLAAEGYQTTARFSPGYCDWEVASGQEAIFRFLSPGALGITLSPGSMMIPRKSISACIVGAREVSLKSPCGSCSKADCLYRRCPGTHELASKQSACRSHVPERGQPGRARLGTDHSATSRNTRRRAR